MKKIFLLILLSFNLFANSNQKVIAQIGNQFITVEDFIKRSEYTPRPLFCNGDSNIEKRIILNNLIGEKLFSMQFNQSVPRNIQDYLEGRKNQKMREVLFNKIAQYESDEKDKFSHWNNLALLEYDISYMSISDFNLVSDIETQISEGKSLQDIYFNYTNKTNLPKKENLNLFTIDNRALREILFATEWDSETILGPIETDNMFMFLVIDKKRKKIDLNPNSIVQLQEEVSSLIVTHLKEDKYSSFVEDLMEEMEFELNREVYIEFSNTMRTWYSSMQDVDNGSFSNNHVKLEIENKNQILLTLNKKELTVGEVLNWIRLHPLVFRDGHYKELDFIHQLKFALADLIRDRFLNIKSKELNLDNHISVLLEYNTWYDNYCAISHRSNVFGEDLITNSKEVTDELNEYFHDLTQKYSDIIKIDFDVLSDIKLSSIDMISYNKVGPYKLTVPLFPIITDSYKFDYGESVTMGNK